jgi:two-component sensor histidine kinase/CHASE3 domain sensor protein
MTHLARVVTSSLVLLSLGFAGLLAIVVMTYLVADRARTGLVVAVEAREIRIAVEAAGSAMLAAESSQRGYLLTGNEIYLAPYDSARARAFESLERLTALLTEPGDQPAVERLTALVRQKFADIELTIELQRQGLRDQMLAQVDTNRGKALMDEANLFISSISRSRDNIVADSLAEQRRSLSLLRIITAAVAVLVVIVVAIVIAMLWNFGKRLNRAKREVETLNQGLETRVRHRTAELEAERDRAELLMREVNHRVSNSLSIVASLLSMQARHQSDEQSRKILTDTQARIAAVALVHRKLYTSGDVRFVDVAEFLASLLAQLERSLRDAGSTASLRHDLASVNLGTDKTVTLGIVVSELVTNAFKYAYPDAEGVIRVTFRPTGDGRAELLVEDEGVGIDDGKAPRGTGLGSKLVQAMASSLGGTVEYRRRTPGTAVCLTFPLA